MSGTIIVIPMRYSLLLRAVLDQFAEQTVELSAGEMYVVPKGVTQTIRRGGMQSNAS